MRTVLVLYILISLVKCIDGTFQCVTEGMFANPNDPGSFYHCAHGIAYLKHCPPTLVWSQVGQYCDRQGNYLYKKMFDFHRKFILFFDSSG